MNDPSTQTLRASTFLVKPRFAGVVVVCGDCQNRSSGPSRLKAKQVRKEIKRDPDRASLRLRVVESGCLGMCPRKAIAAVAFSKGAGMRAAELHSLQETGALLTELHQGNAG